MSRKTEDEFSAHEIIFPLIYGSNEEMDLLLELGNRGPPWGNGRLRSLPVFPRGQNGDRSIREKEEQKAQSLDSQWITRTQEVQYFPEGRDTLPSRMWSKTTWVAKALASCVVAGAQMVASGIKNS